MVATVPASFSALHCFSVALAAQYSDPAMGESGSVHARAITRSTSAGVIAAGSGAPIDDDDELENFKDAHIGSSAKRLPGRQYHAKVAAIALSRVLSVARAAATGAAGAAGAAAPRELRGCGRRARGRGASRSERARFAPSAGPGRSASAATTHATMRFFILCVSLPLSFSYCPFGLYICANLTLID